MTGVGTRRRPSSPLLHGRFPGSPWSPLRPDMRRLDLGRRFATASLPGTAFLSSDAGRPARHVSIFRDP